MPGKLARRCICISTSLGGSDSLHPIHLARLQSRNRARHQQHQSHRRSRLCKALHRRIWLQAGVGCLACHITLRGLQMDRFFHAFCSAWVFFPFREFEAGHWATVVESSVSARQGSAPAAWHSSGGWTWNEWNEWNQGRFPALQTFHF